MITLSFERHTLAEVLEDIQKFYVENLDEGGKLVGSRDPEPDTVTVEGVNSVPDGEDKMEPVSKRRTLGGGDKPAKEADDKPAKAKKAKPKKKSKIKDADLTKAASVAATAITPVVVKEIITEYGVTDVADIEDAQRQDFLDALTKAKKEAE